MAIFPGACLARGGWLETVVEPNHELQCEGVFSMAELRRNIFSRIYGKLAGIGFYWVPLGVRLIGPVRGGKCWRSGPR